MTVQVPESLIARMFRGEVVIHKVSQAESTYFLDRDPKHFQRILNYMRDGSCVIPSSSQEQAELLAEAAYYQLTELKENITSKLHAYGTQSLEFDFKNMVLQHHAQTGRLEACMATLMDFIKEHLVNITPVSDVCDDNRLHIFWLSPSMPPANPAHIVFRYRGDKECNDVGVDVGKSSSKFADWNRLWDVWNNKELIAAFKLLAHRHGLKLSLVHRNEIFKQDGQLDVIWKMYRVRSLTIGVAARAAHPK